MGILVIFFLAYFLKCYYEHLAFLDEENRDFFMFFKFFKAI